MFGAGVAYEAGAPIVPPRTHPNSMRIGYRGAGFAVTPALHGDLLLAAEAGQLDMVEALLKKERIDPMRLNPQGDTALHRAAIHGHVPVVKLLLKHGVIDPNHVGGPCDESALHLAARGGHAETCAALLADERVEAGMFSERGSTPLHLAAQGGHVETVRVLAPDERSVPDAHDNSGWTALHFAAECGYADCCEALLEEGRCDPEIESCGETALHMAAAKGHAAVVATLLKDPRVDPLHVTMSGRVSTHKSSWNAHESWQGGRTALHLAAVNGHVNVARLLDPEGGAGDLDGAGDTPGYLAQLHGHKAVGALFPE